VTQSQEGFAQHLGQVRRYGAFLMEAAPLRGNSAGRGPILEKAEIGRFRHQDVLSHPTTGGGRSEARTLAIDREGCGPRRPTQVFWYILVIRISSISGRTVDFFCE
jgi:hypothetical protein